MGNRFVPWQILPDCAHAVFFFSTMLLLADSFALVKRLLTITALTGNFRSYLIFLEVIIGWIFAILSIPRSLLTVIARFLLRVSGFCYHFKAFEIILSEHPIICCTSLYVFPFPINFLIQLKWHGSFYFAIQKEIYFITMCETFASLLI